MNKEDDPSSPGPLSANSAGQTSILTSTLTTITTYTANPTPAAATTTPAGGSSPAGGGEPSVNQKLFLVVSVALATVCFFTNALQVAVFVRRAAVHSVKGVLLLSQALSGLVATFIVAFPIHVISTRGGTGGTEGYGACYLGHSGVIVLVAITSLGTSTLLLFHQYMKTNDPRMFMTAGSNVVGWSVGVGMVWVVGVVLAVLPYAGWNTWQVHDARCHLSTLWPLGFTAFLIFLVSVHVAAAFLMWASTHSVQVKATVGRRATATTATAPHDVEEVPIANHVSGLHSGASGGVRISGWCISVGSVFPLLAHVSLASSCAASTQCHTSPGHYHEDSASLPWATLLLTVAAVANPLLYVFTDDQVSSSTLLLLSRVCCWWCERRKERLVPRQQEPHDTETNVYVTNDTDHLVDNT